MIGKEAEKKSRREIFRETGRVAAASALAGIAIPAVHAAEDNTIQIVLIGTGGRGTGAASNALSTQQGPVKLVAMADLFPDRLQSSLENLTSQHGGKVDVPPERRFLGFDAYRKAIDCLRPGDVALLTTHAAFRATHLEYAVEKGINAFMEKSFAPDPAGTKKMMAIGEAAKQKNLKIAAGLMCRHSVARQAMIDKIRAGEMGEIELIRANRLGGSIALGPFKGEGSELEWQIRRPYYFHWTSSGLFIEMTIHQIDECCWLKDGWPVSAHGLGGRVADSEDCSQNLDSYSIEYTFADGTKALVQGRYLSNCQNEFATFVHGTKRAAQFSGNIHAADVHMYKDQHIASDNLLWSPDPEPCDPWQAEWNDLMAAIRADKPYNETERACLANMACIMGRAAVHTGSIITWDQMMASNFSFYPDVASLNYESPPPVKANAQGRYQVPIPGLWTEI